MGARTGRAALAAATAGAVVLAIGTMTVQGDAASPVAARDMHPAFPTSVTVSSVVAAERAAAQSQTTANRAAAAAMRMLTLRVPPATGGGQDVDLPPAGPSPGDFFLFRSRLLNRTGTGSAGRIAVRVENGQDFTTVEATLDLWGRGKIRVAGSLFSETDNVLPITGGTGSFSTIDGDLHFTNQTDGSTILVLRFEY